MTKRSIKLSIPKGCNQRWENFVVTGQQGFCSSCNKTVIDFTRMGDDQIVAFFRANNSHTCGRFRPDQLREYDLTPVITIRPGTTLLKAGILSLLLLLVNKNTHAQSTIKTESELVQQSNRNGTPVREDEGIILRGVVLQKEDNSPVPGATVVLRGTTEGIVTDADGKFTFPSKVKHGDVLVFAFIGFQSQEYRIKETDADNFELSISMSLSMDIMGEVHIDGLYSENRKPGLWLRFKNLFRPAI